MGCGGSKDDKKEGSNNPYAIKYEFKITKIPKADDLFSKVSDALK